jgi:hypothetical protein
MNQGTMWHMIENTAMTGAPGYTSWIQLQQYSHASKSPTDALLARMTTTIQSSSIGSHLFGLVECADVTSLGCRLLLRLRARFCALLTLD